MIFYALKLRAYAIIAVLLIHISARYVTQEIGTLNWWIGNVLDSSVRWSVPIFIMLSGMLLLKKEETIGVIFKKRINKLIWPLLFWSLIFSLWQSRYDISSFNIKDTFIAFLQGDIKYHLWYLYAILGLYIALPLFRVFVKHADKLFIKYFIILSFIISSISTLLWYLYQIRLMNGFEYFLGYGSYFLLGFYLANYTITNKKEKIIYLFGGLGLIGTIIGTWYVSLQQGSLNQVFYQYLTITTPFVAMAVFLLVKKYGDKKSSNIMSLISKYSFGIYLVHPIFLDIYRGKEFVALTNVSMQNTPAIIYIIFVFIITIVSSLIFSMLLKRIPIFKHLV